MARTSRDDMAPTFPEVLDDRDDHRCPRCEGFLVDDWLLDMAQGGYLWGAGRRCVNCGHIMQIGVCQDRAPRASESSARSSSDGQSWHEAA